MGIMRYNYRSEALSLYTDITITYPSGEYTSNCKTETLAKIAVTKKTGSPYVPGMKFQTVYLLHGGGDDDTTMQRLTRLESYAEKNNVMTVTPQVKDSFFMDTASGFKYFTYVTEELPLVVRSLFSSSGDREDNFVVGMAMGGNAALALALRRPDLYYACVDLSGGIGCSVDTDFFIKCIKEDVFQRVHGAFGEAAKLRDSEYDIGYYARRNKEQNIPVPEFFIGVGKNDFIRDKIKVDRDALVKLGYNVTYEEAEGFGHDWDFWDLYLKKTFYKWLPLKRKAIYP
jgi:putative tributyrin esterase